MSKEDNVKKVKELLVFPPGLCTQCGTCCNCANFVGNLCKEEIFELLVDPNVEQKRKDGANDFLALFEAYKNEVVQEKYPEIFELVKSRLGENLKEHIFFKCRFYDGGCTIYMERPGLCRAFPVIHPTTHYFPNCGYQKVGEERWAQIQEILDSLDDSKEK